MCRWSFNKNIYVRYLIEEIPTLSRTGDVAKKKKKKKKKKVYKPNYNLEVHITDLPSKVSQCSFDLLSYP